MAETRHSAVSGLLAGWIRLVRRGAWFVLILSLLGSAAAATYTATHLGMNTNTLDILSEELPLNQNRRILEDAFPTEYRTIIAVVEADTAAAAETAASRLAEALSGDRAHFHSVFYPDGDPFFRRNALLYLDLEPLYVLSDDLARAQPLLAGLRDDMTLRGLSSLLVQVLEDTSEDGASLQAALGEMADTVERVAAGRPASFSWRSLFDAALQEEAVAGRRVMILEPVIDYGSLQPATPAVEAVRRTVEALGLTPENGVRVRLTGQLLMFQEEIDSVQRGVGFVSLVSLLLVLSLLLVGLRSIPMVAATLVTLVMGLIWTACFAAVAVGELNLMSITFAVLFIGLSVDFGIHFALRTREAIDQGASPAAALESAAAKVGGALLLAAVAAAIGFLSFLPTTYRGLSELGLIAGAGMFIALFANLTVLPALLSLMPPKPAPLGHAEAGLDRWLSVTARRPGRVVVGALLLGLAAACALPFVRFDDNLLNLRDPESESVAALLDLMDDPRIEPFKASTLAADEAAARELGDRLLALPEVERVVTLLDFVPSDQEEKLDVLSDIWLLMGTALTPAEARAPPTADERRAAIERLRSAASTVTAGGLQPGAGRLAAALERTDTSETGLLRLETALLGELPGVLDGLAEALDAAPVELERLPAALVEGMRTDDGRMLVEIYPAEDLRDEAERLQFVEAVQAVAPRASGEPIIVTEAGRAVREAFIEAGAYAGVLVFLLLVVVLRSLVDAAMIMAPLALATLLTMAAGVAFGLPLNFANVIVLPLLFGLGVAGGVHIVVRDRELRSGDLLRTYTPRAVVFSALTTIGSFGALGLSSHPGTASMGILLTIAITLAALCTVVVLPALRRVVRGAAPAIAGD